MSTTGVEPAAAGRVDWFTTADGTRLHVAEHGAADAEYTLILLHGWTLTRHSWQWVIEDLLATSPVPLRVLSYDHRGHGSSDPAPTGTATIEQIADDLAELIEARVPTGPVVLAGHSMGGMTIMALAERHPDLVASRVAGAAFVATSSGGLRNLTFGLPQPVASVIRRIERVAQRFERGTQQRTGTGGGAAQEGRKLPPPVLRWLLFGERPALEMLTATVEWVAQCHPASMAGFRASLDEHERTAALAVLRDVPSVVLCGSGDRLCPEPHARVIVRELPRAELIIYGGAGHMLPLERHADVARQILRVLVAAGARR